ncbi:hypothetical protein OpiT1DRAFT_05632 [Opitutaceae bacterium TAV1]|nr:hypothetical protein OpiT1DRAFT_05632 [Opitutaceae bacterium TAV1]
MNTLGGEQDVTLWTKRGVIRLGFFIKSERAKKFRNAAEDLTLWYTEGSLVPASSVTETISAADLFRVLVQNQQVLADVAATLRIFAERLGRIESAVGPIPEREFLVDPNNLTLRQRSVLSGLTARALPAWELGLDREMGVLHALERTGLVAQSGMGWRRLPKGDQALAA